MVAASGDAEGERHDRYRMLQQPPELVLPAVGVGGIGLREGHAVPRGFGLQLGAVGGHRGGPRRGLSGGQRRGRDEQVHAEWRIRHRPEFLNVRGECVNGLVSAGEKAEGADAGGRGDQAGVDGPPAIGAVMRGMRSWAS